MKTIAIVTMLDVMSEAAFGRSMSESIAAGICVSCGKPSGTFRDTLSMSEYLITGMCQSCQDDFDATFAEDEE